MRDVAVAKKREKRKVDIRSLRRREQRLCVCRCGYHYWDSIWSGEVLLLSEASKSDRDLLLNMGDFEPGVFLNAIVMECWKCAAARAGKTSVGDRFRERVPRTEIPQDE